MPRIPCTKCGAEILESTFRVNEGLCGPCAKKAKKESELSIHLNTPGCPCCDGKGFINFLWTENQSSSFPELSKYRKYLVQLRALKLGSEWSCRVCQQKWYLDHTKSMMHQVPKDREEILETWNRKELSLQPSLLVALGSIGATPQDIYGNGRDRITIPCRVQTTLGKVCDPALVCFQPGPPIQPWDKNIHFVDEVVSVECSDFALPADIRVATTEADEIRMGLAPTVVSAPNGELFCLNWTTNFFVHPSIKAGSLVLAGASWRQQDITKYVNEDDFGIHWFFGDWRDELLRLRLRTKTPRNESPLQIVSTSSIIN